MMRTVLNPSDNKGKRLYRITAEGGKRPRLFWATDLFVAFRKYYCNNDREEYEALKDFEIEIAGGCSNMLDIWVGTDQYTIEDLTAFKEDYV